MNGLVKFGLVAKLTSLRWLYSSNYFVKHICVHETVILILIAFNIIIVVIFVCILYWRGINSYLFNTNIEKWVSHWTNLAFIRFIVYVRSSFYLCILLRFCWRFLIINNLRLFKSICRCRLFSRTLWKCVLFIIRSFWWFCAIFF